MEQSSIRNSGKNLVDLSRNYIKEDEEALRLPENKWSKAWKCHHESILNAMKHALHHNKRHLVENHKIFVDTESGG